jgi:hypothetical protein
MKHLSTASGIDEFSYEDIMEIPNENLRALLQTIIDTKIFPLKWLVALIAGILKGRKDPKMPESYHLVVLECCLLKFLTLLIDQCVKEYTLEAKLIPETQNGFMATYHTNNNPFLLCAMSDRAAAKGKVMYVAVVDFKNTFPTVN